MQGPRRSRLHGRRLLLRARRRRCPCGCRRSVVAFVTDATRTRSLLTTLGLPADPATFAPARDPPQPELPWADPAYPQAIHTRATADRTPVARGGSVRASPNGGHLYARGSSPPTHAGQLPRAVYCRRQRNAACLSWTPDHDRGSLERLCRHPWRGLANTAAWDPSATAFYPGSPGTLAVNSP